MSRHQIDYESLVQDAMRGLVRTVLQRVAKTGLPGDHHFYISFHTRAAGVSVSKRLLERYPDEMTIVLQNKFSDLKALDERFEVTLWFDSVAERLIIPYTALKVFFDPSVPYGNQFEVPEAPTATAVKGPVLVDPAATNRGGDKSAGDRAASEKASGDKKEQRPAPVTSMTSSANPRTRQTGHQTGQLGASPSGPASGGKDSKPAPHPPAIVATTRPNAETPSAAGTPAAPPADGASARPDLKAPAAKPAPAQRAASAKADQEKPGPEKDGVNQSGAKPARSTAPPADKAAHAVPASEADKPAAETPAAPANKVVALDAFRKKS